MSAVLYVWRSGVMRVGRQCPSGALALATGPERRLRQLMCARSRHAYDGRTRLLPGIPEADTEQQALKALNGFLDWMRSTPEPGVSYTPGPIRLPSETNRRRAA